MEALCMTPFESWQECSERTTWIRMVKHDAYPHAVSHDAVGHDHLKLKGHQLTVQS